MPGNSQILLNDSTCIVPCNTLRNALIMNSELTLVRSRLEVTSDSIVILNKIMIEYDSLVYNYKSLVTEKNQIIVLKDSIQREQNLQIGGLKGELDKTKRERDIAIVGGVVGVLLTVLAALVF